jgi:hypothetical protein
MKNWLNLVTLTLARTSRMTVMQRLILIGSIILPAGSLILIFSQYGRRIIRKLTKAKTSKTFGNVITEEEIYEQLYK